MSIAIMSDFHANLEAAEAVFRDRDSLNRQGRGIDKTYCLGDLVDYGANPREVIDLVRRECDLVLTGNHDVDVSRRHIQKTNYGSIENNNWESNTVDITKWTRELLSKKQLPTMLNRLLGYSNGGGIQIISNTSHLYHSSTGKETQYLFTQCL
ncbi:MAG: metallophosphoesterase [Candidatus Aenigmarchaeota archaeon]|nr:metallophosphoesterase [Candidatus Aenigmarchaeota archaeon]